VINTQELTATASKCNAHFVSGQCNPQSIDQIEFFFFSRNNDHLDGAAYRSKR
jgi:hypothetical protein